MITAYRYGSPRQPGEGLRLGVTRHLPRGVRREDWGKKNYFDLRVVLLAPSAGLLKLYLQDRITFAKFGQRYHREMATAECRQTIELLAAMSFAQSFSIGCFCKDESRCHRSILKKLLQNEVRKIKPIASQVKKWASESRERLSSPVCYAEEED